MSVQLTLCESEVAFVSEGSVDQFAGIPLVLIRVVKLCIYHTQHSMPCVPGIITHTTAKQNAVITFLFPS